MKCYICNAEMNTAGCPNQAAHDSGWDCSLNVNTELREQLAKLNRALDEWQRDYNNQVQDVIQLRIALRKAWNAMLEPNSMNRNDKCSEWLHEYRELVNDQTFR